MAAMKCRMCGAEMNHHADKLVHVDSAEGDAGQEQVAEMHTCPECGHGDMRMERER